MISDAEAPAPACRIVSIADGEVADSGTLREPPKGPARRHAGCRSRRPAPPAMIEIRAARWPDDAAVVDAIFREHH
ncbi:hypothetical protein [Burkholderia sp. Tr-862]|uniref:hypothetical protein n=1 Tax=Burkholderia sp. Tr-862 TaxID=2608331 RepID=UPI001FFDDE7E|nr:hypothetical protein [Burkholderia sp. Tr-862]